ncbi:uncharacterized protein N7525_002327 [Penicillium rubens]|uniref:uncharacterized protein n=1 Tax=Penicillium rubens TaxID=1108849 RepID=UPI002A59DA73|nr:uncharacterized protein N7525_002327 [Penicillium rubens]KAJ5844586.1 hypothetical protein N7525_002327 [Penicillium rubens]
MAIVAVAKQLASELLGLTFNSPLPFLQPSTFYSIRDRKTRIDRGDARDGRGRPTWRIETTAFAMGDTGNDLSDSLLEALLDSVFVADM